MTNAFHREAAERILEAMHHPGGQRGNYSFMFRRPGAAFVHENIGAAVYVPRTAMIRASHYIRKNGPPYLRYLDLAEVRSLITGFIAEFYWIVAGEAWGATFEGSYADRLTPATKTAFGDAFATSKLIRPVLDSTIYPLVTIRVDVSRDHGCFFLAPPSSLVETLGEQVGPSVTAPDRFPPLPEARYVENRPQSWLGVRAPAQGVANKIKSAILGAIALNASPIQRHMFSGRNMFGGRFTPLPGGAGQFSAGEPATPPLMSDLSITGDDAEWLAELARLLASVNGEDRRKLFALEYFYRAWPLEKAARFPVYCMALDGVFGDANQATKSVIDGVSATLGAGIDARRIGDLMALRASVIHGGAPDVYDSRKYARYYETYLTDPLFDLELVVSECLRRRIFGDRIPAYQDAYVDFMAELSQRGERMLDSFETAIVRPLVRQTPGVTITIPKRGRSNGG